MLSGREKHWTEFEDEWWNSTSKHFIYSFIWKQSGDSASYDGHCFVTKNSTILI